MIKNQKQKRGHCSKLPGPVRSLTMAQRTSGGSVPTDALETSQ